MTPEERYREKVKQGDGCWIWTGATNGRYGRLKFYGEYSYAHRVAWFLAYGRIPDGKQVLHRCDNPPCVRPDHLFLGTQAENMDDMARKGRARDVLREHDARAIRAAVAGGASRRGTAKAFKVSRTLVRLIADGKKWKRIHSGEG